MVTLAVNMDPDKQFARTQRYFLLFIFGAVLLIALLIYNSSIFAVTPKAKAGILELNGSDKNEIIPLSGAWNFYWGKLLNPETLSGSGAPAPDAHIAVPGIWNNTEINGKKTPAMGFATYSLIVKQADTAQLYALNLRTMSNAYRLWIDDHLLAENGKVGELKSESQPAYKPQVVFFRPAQSTFRVVVQVSNFHHCKGGFWLAADLGTPAKIMHEREMRTLLEMFLFGSLFIMALYHFSLYILRRNDTAVLFFGLMCLIICIRSLFTGEILVAGMLPDLSWFASRRIEYILTFVSAPVYAAFSRKLYPDEWNTLAFRVVTGFGLVLASVVLLTPSELFTNLSYVFTVYAWLTSMYTIWIFSRAALRKKEGAGIFLATSLVFLLTIVNDTLNQLEIIHTGLYLSLGLFVVTFAQSFSLSSRFANAFRTTEIYASTFRKFVPVQFLDKIAKDGISSIKPGNAEHISGTVLFSDIRSFTSISEKLKPGEVFSMLNKYLAYVEPPIRRHHGYVDKYMGDGIMALFENTGEHVAAVNAIHAALEMQQQLVAFNKTRTAAQESELLMGIGLHSGPMIIGTVGGTERMDSTAIGDAVNLTSRIEGMTKMYGVPLLASGETVMQEAVQELFLFRFIDLVAAKGKDEPVAIWEIIGYKNDPAAQARAQLLQPFQLGLDAFRAQRFAEAKTHFEQTLAAVPGDAVSQLYISRCAAFLAGSGTPGVHRLDEK
jgi:class 3 adenylate cyclase